MKEILNPKSPARRVDPLIFWGSRTFGFEKKRVVDEFCSSINPAAGRMRCEFAILLLLLLFLILLLLLL